MTLASGKIAELAGRPFGGDVEFEQYVTESRQRLYRLAVVLCGDTVLAADLLTDVLRRAYERWDQVSAADNVHAYVRRMIVNEFVSWKRRRLRTAPHPDVGLLLDGQAARTRGPDHEHEHEHAERTALLAELSHLPPRQRAAITLRYYQDLTDAEIAGVMDCRVTTVRSNISRGLAALRITMITPDEETTP